MQLWKLNCYEPVQLVEEELQHWKLLFVEMRHIKHFSDTHQGLEGQLFISEHKEEEASNKVHTLAIFDLWIEEGIGLEYVIQDLWLHDVAQVVERSLDIHRNELTHRALECLHLIHFTIIFKHPVLVGLAVDLISESKIVFGILVNAKDPLPDGDSFLSELALARLVYQSLFENLLQEQLA